MDQTTQASAPYALLVPIPQSMLLMFQTAAWLVQQDPFLAPLAPQTAQSVQRGHTQLCLGQIQQQIVCCVLLVHIRPMLESQILRCAKDAHQGPFPQLMAHLLHQRVNLARLGHTQMKSFHQLARIAMLVCILNIHHRLSAPAAYKESFPLP